MSLDDDFWRERIVEWIHRDKGGPGRNEHYRGMVRKWAEGTLDARLTASVVLPISIPALPWTVDEKYTILAAMHDAFCACDAQVNPWSLPFESGLSDADKARELDLCECYEDLKRAARQKSKEYQRDLERLLEDVRGAGQGGDSQVGNKTEIIMGDKYENLQGSPVISRSEVKGSFNPVRVDHSTTGAGSPKGFRARLFESILFQVVAFLIGLFIVGIGIWKWPWIKAFLW